MATKSELVFLLGAGATVDAGLPTSTKLTELVADAIAEKHNGLLPVHRYVSGAIQFGKGCKGEALSGQINIEELLTACTFLSSRDTSYVYPFVSAWHERIGKLQGLPDGISVDSMTDSFGYLFKFCKQGLRDWLTVKQPARLKYLRSFRDFANAGYKLRIFTLNYDECIELALSDELGPINRHWTNGFSQKGWDSTLLDSPKFSAYVYKLHGSLDWVDDEKLGICSVKWPSAEDTEELPDSFDSLLIFGTDIKLQAVNPFLTLLFRFQEMLSRNNLLVVIGYSFGDSYINAMVLKAMQRNPRMRCIVVNKSGISKLLPDNFRPLVVSGERFISLEMTARKAFESDALLGAVKDTAKAYKKEMPF